LDEIWYAEAESHANDDENARVKPEVKFQYGGHLFLETGSSNISAAGWATLSKFSVQIDFDVLSCDMSSKWKPEVNFRRCGRHLENH